MRADPMRNIGWIAALSISIIICDIGEFGGARAESKNPPKRTAAASALSPHWNHNGSLVSLVSQGAKQKFFYDTPRIGLLDAGVKPGTMLFEGQRNGQNFEGTAYQFYRTCKARGFPVTGSTSDDRRQITLKGKAPLLDMSCNVTGSRDDTLIFTASQIAPNEPPKETPVAGASGTKATTQAPNVVEAKNSAAAVAAVPNTPPEAGRVTDTPAVEGSNAKPGDSNAASNAVSVASAVAPSEVPKDKQVTTSPAPETVPPNEPAEDAKQPAATQTASTTANSLAAGSGAAPPSEPAKASQSAAVPGANAGTSRSDVTNTANNQPERSSSAPPSELPKDTQMAAIPGAAGNAAKNAAKTDDTSKSKNAATAAVVSAPNILPDKSKSDVSKTDSIKTPAFAEIRAVPTGPPEKMMEIVLKNGRILRIGRDIELEALSRIISQLER